jgi:uncharacterized protein
MSNLQQTPPISSPCNSVCRMSEKTGFCEGCFRTIDEIVAWGQLPDNGKRTVLEQIAAREKAYAA